jgi:hypothetical protein
MAGQMSREEALKSLAQEPVSCAESELSHFLADMKMTKSDFDRYIEMGPRYIAFRQGKNVLWKFASAVKRRLFTLMGIR